MPAFDACHDQVVRALEKDGWRVDNHQIRIATGKRRAFIDLRAVRQTNGTRQQIMLAEVKCFSERSQATQELYTAIGQFLVYRAMLVELDDETPLYLCVPQFIYDTIFDTSVERVVREGKIKLLIVNLEAERIVRWSE